MSEPAAAPRPAGLAARSATCSLDAAVARMAGRLSAVLAALDVRGEDQATVGFLRAHAAGVPGGRPADGSCLDLPAPGAAEPVDRLVAALRPSPMEIDLLVLACAAHHHEGLAAVFRGLHPQGQPWPSVGLAGLLAEHGALASKDTADRLPCP